jgi:uncharacterized protein (TIGR01777 family)
VCVSFIRTGVVLSKDGGALPKLMMPFRFGAGGHVGNGRQWMSWIALDDLVSAIEFLLSRRIPGAFNATSPQPVTSHDFARALGKVIHRPAVIPAPAFALRTMLGQMADETILVSQRAIPHRLQRSGFVFRYPDIHGALSHELSR